MNFRFVLLVVLLGCAERGGSSAPSTPPANFELDCAASNTATAAQVNCVRTDTRSGDVVVLDYMRLPVSAGSTATGAAVAGRFTTACAATSTDQKADFYCIRLNTETGEALLVNLQKVNVLPPKT